jgi:hypothetical protein
MNYKYDKYECMQKNNSLQYKNNMIGGDTPKCEAIKNINIFENDSFLEIFLNPTYGFLWNESSAVNNCFNYNVKNDQVCELIKLSYIEVIGKLKPTNILMEVEAKQWGVFLANLFLCMLYNRKITNLNKFSKYIDSFNSIIQNIEKKKKLQKKQKTQETQENKNKNYHLTIKNNIEFINNNDNLTSKIDVNSICNDDTSLDELKNICIYYKNKLNHYTSQCNNTINIINKNKLKFNFNINYNDINDNHIFHAILSIAWWTFNNKEGIKQYYNGLHEVFNNEYVYDDIKNEFNKAYEKINANEFKENYDSLFNLRNDHFNDALYYIYNSNYGNLKLFNTEASYYKHKKFPNCGESSVRNFINIMMFAYYGGLNKDFLTNIGAKNNSLVMQYYTVFDTIDKQSSTETYSIFDPIQKLSAKDAWNVVVSNLEYVKYIDFVEIDNKNHYYNIAGGLSYNKIPNLLQVLQMIFSNDKLSWDTFTQMNNKTIIINNALDLYGIGSIEIITNMKYKWHFYQNHYDIEKVITQNNNNLQINTMTLSENKKMYLHLFNDDQDDIFRINIPKMSKWYYFAKNKNNAILHMIDMINSLDLNKKIYNIYFNFLNQIATNQEKKNIQINIEKLDKLNYDFEAYNLDITFSPTSLTDDSKTIKNIVSINNLIFPLNKNIEIFENLQHLTLQCSMPNDNELKLPESLLHLRINGFFNKEINNLPTKLTTLVLNDDFNSKIDFTNNLSLITLIFRNNYNQKNTILPKNLTTLILGNNYNQENTILPEKLTTLIFCNNFNSKIDFTKNLSLTTLTFGYDYNQENTILPENLTTLTFGDSFNSKIDFTNNLSLTTLTFGRHYNQENTILPKNLITLTFGDSFNSKIDFTNNLSLTTLTFGQLYNQKNTILPKNLITLTFGDGFNSKIDFTNNLSLTTLIFGQFYNQENTILPKNLITLIFGNNFNSKIDFTNNLSLTTLIFGYNYNQKITNLPKNLTTLTFGKKFEQNIFNFNLITYLLNDTSKAYDLLLPNTLQKLTFEGYMFNKMIKTHLLPKIHYLLPNITSLIIHKEELLNK